MKNKSWRGRAALHDLGPAGGVYEVDYIIHTSVQESKNIGMESTTHKVSSADIRSINGYQLKNGDYTLDQTGGVARKLRKTGALWELVA